ncbi:hypothetical protein N7478_007084 [Penicillium angulare]|uniref:uncharacterized protein n=1 Tax=Penicillium angulare TaxID=116970 RepID=UPI00253F9A47|nr:uncharacterized protein N7478_007084 [Penicillium angulare]KAJ5281712.1 hypothetical protein N7478_007084 [Penicillium angulare]
MSFALGATIIFVLATFYAGVVFRLSKWKRPPLPPGPPGKPFIGNLWDLSSPNQQEWEHFFKLKEIYGPISYMNVGGHSLMMLNDAKLALQLLEKRSSIHSSRPAHAFLDIEAGAIILKIAYGYTIEPHNDDPLVNLADKAMQGFSIAFSSTTWAVNFMPILKSLPTWFPGAGFLKLAQEFKTDAQALAEVPHEFVTQQMKNGSFSPSFLSEVLQKHPVEPGSKEEIILKWSAGSMYAGGSDTTVSSISCFFLAMALFPEAQSKAQEELDSIIGNCQLPQLEDRKQLPYIDAVVKEVLRWHPVVPVNIPHVSTQDDVCEGFLIPKGSWVIANIWGMTHDPSIYEEPMSFRPERFLDSLNGHPPAPDPHRLVFGFGRRACPGRILADSNIFLTVAQCLATFNISKPVENGKVQDITAVFNPGLISHPAPYKVSIYPRSPKHRALVESLETRYPWENSDADLLASVSKS